MKQTPESLRKEAMTLFLKNFSGKDVLPLEYFHAFLCPVAIAETTVTERTVEDFDALQLLILRLYDAGFHDPVQLSSLSGMRLEMVEKALENEIKIAGHIDSDTGAITQTGAVSLEECKNGTPKSHVIYTNVRKLQIEAATGTVIPSYLETKIGAMKPLLPDDREGIVPRESVEQDEELLREINQRLDEYIDKSVVIEKAPIENVANLRSTQILYRWAYIAKFQGMTYPMVIMTGRRTIDNVNAQAKRSGNYGESTALPVSISESDSRFLIRHGMSLPEVLVREDRFFDYLLEKAATLDLLAEETQTSEADETEVTDDE